MSNWFIYQHHNDQIKACKSQPAQVFLMLASVVIIIVGIWLNIRILDYYNSHPGENAPLSIKSRQQSFFHAGVVHW